MSASVELALPCRLVTLHLRVGLENGVTTLEDLVARAVLIGHTRVESLAGLFALPERVVIDVVGTLWGKGHLTVDFENGFIDLSDEAREVLTSASGASLARTNSEPLKEKFLFEPITGLILAERRGDRRPGSETLQVPLRYGITESDIPQVDLVRAVQAEFRREQRRRLRRNVLEVSFGNPVLREPTELRWLHLAVSVARDTQSDRLSVTLHDSRLGAQAQQRLNNHLADLADHEPDNRFVQQLKGRAVLRLQAPERVMGLLRRMAEKINELDATSLEQVGERQDVLTGMARRLHDRLAVANRNRAATTVVRHPDGHAWAVEELIKSARSQLVLAVPTMEYQALREVLPVLHEALARSVHLVVLWGQSYNDQLPTRVESALDELTVQHRTRVLIAKQSSRTEACLLVQDDCRALVGSHSPLGAPPPGERDVSVLIEPVGQGGDPPLAVVDLLLWARKQFPSWSLGRRIKLHHHDFDSEDRIAPPVKTTMDVPVPKIDLTAIDGAALNLWVTSWVEHHASLVEAWARAGRAAPVVEVVQDGEHRAILWHGLRTAERRLIITDDRIHPRVADEALAEAIRGRRKAGATVHLAHPPVPHKGRPSSESFAFLDTGPERAQVRLVQSVGRVVVADDEVLIGSFSPLSERAGKPGIDWDRRNQLGLHIQGEAFAAELASALQVPSVEAPRKSAPVRTPTPSGPKAVALPLLVEARAALNGTGFGRSVVDRLRDIDSPWLVVDQWQNHQVPTHDLRVAVAALLQAGIDVESAGGERWARWLVGDAWERRAFVEAALLGRLLPQRPSDLDTSAVLVAALELGPLGGVASDAALELMEQPVQAARAAGAAGALGEVLLWGGQEGAEALRLLGDALPPIWQDLAEEANTFLAAEAIPLPLEVLTAKQTRTTTLRAIEERRKGIIEAIDKLERLRRRFDFGTGLDLHKALFADDGLLTTIRCAARGGIKECAALCGTLPTDMHAYLDVLIARANAEPMQWYRQRGFLRSVEEITHSMRLLATEMADAAASADPTWSMRGCLSIGRHTAAAWDRLFSEATTVPAPYNLPLLAMLDKLGPLARWAREGT